MMANIFLDKVVHDDATTLSDVGYIPNNSDNNDDSMFIPLVVFNKVLLLESGYGGNVDKKKGVMFRDILAKMVMEAMLTRRWV
jgi:hypothetical protein